MADDRAARLSEDLSEFLRKYPYHQASTVNERLIAGSNVRTLNTTVPSYPSPIQYGSSIAGNLSTTSFGYRSNVIYMNATPSLSQSGSTIPSVSSYSRDDEGLVGEGLIDDEGRAPMPRLPCEFSWLSCHETTTLEDWYTHVQSHFRGQEPPKEVFCPFTGCSWTRNVDGDGRTAWGNRKAHIERIHTAGGSLLHELNLKPAPALVLHLASKRLIQPHQAFQLIKYGHLSDMPYRERHGRHPDTVSSGKTPRLRR